MNLIHTLLTFMNARHQPEQLALLSPMAGKFMTSLCHGCDLSPSMAFFGE